MAYLKYAVFFFVCSIQVIAFVLFNLISGCYYLFAMSTQPKLELLTLAALTIRSRVHAKLGQVNRAPTLGLEGKGVLSTGIYKNVGRKPSWCRLNSEYHNPLPPSLFPVKGARIKHPHGCEPSVVPTGQRPWTRPGCKTLPTRDCYITYVTS